MQHLVVLTQKYGNDRIDLLERLFRLLAEKEGNVEVLISFMVNAVQETQNFDLFDVLRTIAVFLGRVQVRVLSRSLRLHVLCSLRVLSRSLSPGLFSGLLPLSLSLSLSLSLCL